MVSHALLSSSCPLLLFLCPPLLLTSCPPLFLSSSLPSPLSFSYCPPILLSSSLPVLFSCLSCLCLLSSSPPGPLSFSSIHLSSLPSSQGDANRSYSEDDKSSSNFEETEKRGDSLHLSGSLPTSPPDRCVSDFRTFLSFAERFVNNITSQKHDMLLWTSQLRLTKTINVHAAVLADAASLSSGKCRVKCHGSFSKGGERPL